MSLIFLSCQKISILQPLSYQHFWIFTLFQKSTQWVFPAPLVVKVTAVFLLKWHGCGTWTHIFGFGDRYSTNWTIPAYNLNKSRTHNSRVYYFNWADFLLLIKNTSTLVSKFLPIFVTRVTLSKYFLNVFYFTPCCFKLYSSLKPWA